MRHGGKVARILHLLFDHPASFLSWALLWGWVNRLRHRNAQPQWSLLPSDQAKRGQGHERLHQQKRCGASVVTGTAPRTIVVRAFLDGHYRENGVSLDEIEKKKEIGKTEDEERILFTAVEIMEVGKELFGSGVASRSFSGKSRGKMG